MAVHSQSRSKGHMRQDTYQAIRFAWGWMSRAVSPFTICITFTDSGIRGSKKRTSPLTLQERTRVMLADGNLRDTTWSCWGRDLALKEGITGHGKFQCPLAHAGKAQTPPPCHPLVLAARVPIKLPVSGQTRLGLTKERCHAQSRVYQGLRGDYKRCQRLQREVEPTRAEDGRGSLVEAQPHGGQVTSPRLQPSVSMCTPTIMLGFMPQTRGKEHFSEEVVAL